MPISDYLKELIKGLVTVPEDVRVTETHDEMGILLSVNVNKADMGTIIGKAGETAKTIRHLVRIAGIKTNSRVSVKINEPDGSFYKSK